MEGLTPDAAHGDITAKLLAYVRAQYVKEIRVLHDTEVVSLLTNVERTRALGVRIRRNVASVDGKSKQTESNFFGDALVFSLPREALATLAGNEIAKVEDGFLYTLKGEVLGGIFASHEAREQRSLDRVISLARLAGRRAYEAAAAAAVTAGVAAVPAAAGGKPPVKQPQPFMDKSGVHHGVALSPTQWIPLVLENRIQLNKFNHLFRFAFDDKDKQAGLFCGQYLSIRAIIDGAEVVRFYSPVSRNSDYGHIDLMIKIEENVAGKPMERFMAELRPGQTVDFKGPIGGFEYHRNMYREVGMIAGGTGITPMVQIIRSIANHPEDDTHARLLYGNYNEEDILCRDELSYYSLTRSNIDVYISLNNPPGKWSMGVGFVDAEMIKKALPAPAHDIVILLCGPPPMIKVMVNILKSLNYTDQMIFSFV